MPPDMVAYLEDSSLKAKMGGGKKLANTEIVRAAVRFLMESEVNISGCKNEEDILLAIRDQLNY